MTFNEKLKLAKAEFEAGLKYNKPAMPEVVGFNQIYRLKYPDKYPYNDAIAEFIQQEVDFDEELMDYLKTEVYLSQQVIHREQEAEADRRQAEKGFTRIKHENMASIPVGVSALLFHGGLLGRQEVKCKIITDTNGQPFFLPARKRNRGYKATTLAYSEYPAYFKVLTN